MSIHKEKSAEDDGLPKKVRRNEVKIKHWNDGQIEKIDKKMRMRKIEIKNKAEKEIVTTVNKFLMDCVLHYSRDEKTV